MGMPQLVVTAVLIEGVKEVSRSCGPQARGYPPWHCR
jgi:hypothetical protein